MSYRLVILGILAEQPQYGYELKQTIERQHFADYIRLSGGGLYYHLRKLKEEGYLEEEAIEHEGSYPDRHIYRLTPRGRHYLIDLLRATLSDVAGRRVYDPIDAALSFAHLISREEVLACLQHQLDYVHGSLAALKFTQQIHQRVLKRTADSSSSPAKSESLYAQLMMDHKMAFLQHEVRWLQETLQCIEEDSNFEAQSVPGSTASIIGDTEVSSEDYTIAGEYTLFEDDLAPMTEALTTYNRQLDLAWQEYQRLIASRPSAGLAEARQAYQQRVAEIQYSYDEAIRCVYNRTEQERP